MSGFPHLLKYEIQFVENRLFSPCPGGKHDRHRSRLCSIFTASRARGRSFWRLRLLRGRQSDFAYSSGRSRPFLFDTQACRRTGVHLYVGPRDRSGSDPDGKSDMGFFEAAHRQSAASESICCWGRRLLQTLGTLHTKHRRQLHSWGRNARPYYGSDIWVSRFPNRVGASLPHHRRNWREILQVAAALGREVSRKQIARHHVSSASLTGKTKAYRERNAIAEFHGK